MEKASGKFKLRKTLTTEERHLVIKEYEKIPNMNRLARLFCCSARQIRSIIQNKNNYLAIDKLDSFSQFKLKQKKLALKSTVLSFLYEWVQRCRCHSITITDDLLIETIKNLLKILNINDIIPSKSLITHFKNKYHLKDSDLLNNHDTNEIYSWDIEKKSLNIEDIIIEIRHQLDPIVVTELKLNTESIDDSMDLRTDIKLEPIEDENFFEIN